MGYIMKRNYILFCFVLIGFLGNAQTAKPAAKAEPPIVSKNAVILFFESALVSGKLTLSKVFTRDQETSNSTVSYSISATSNASQFNNGKPLDIKLNRDSFDGAFIRSSADIAGKSTQLNRFLQEKNIALTDEKGWISLIHYYNSL